MRRILFFVCWLFVGSAQAQALTDSNLFAIDMQEIPPDIKKLEQEYRHTQSSYYWKYDYRWNMPTVFDGEFRDIIKTFGSVEKRISNPDEENILRWLKQLPPEYYPYVGPLLHVTPGLSGKILDLPGIKETKNKFPSRLASVFEDVPDIEFTSPELYIYLMPEVWGEKNSIEYPKTQHTTLQNPHKIKLNPDFIAQVVQNVPAENFTLQARLPQPDLGKRHYFADENTPLSGADVKAFINTSGTIKKFFAQNQNTLKFILIDSLIQYQDKKNGENASAVFLKSVVNPCQTIVRKVKWLRQYSAFQEAISTQGFGLDDWAYICDKTLKAYRVYSMPMDYAGFLNFMRTGRYENMLKEYGYASQELELVRYHHAAFVQMYTSTDNDVKAIKPFVHQLHQLFSDLDVEQSGTPFILP